jgi:hypothetical protein
MLLGPVEKLANLGEVSESDLLRSNSLNERRSQLDGDTLACSKCRVALFDDVMNSIEKVIVRVKGTRGPSR